MYQFNLGVEETSIGVGVTKEQTAILRRSASKIWGSGIFSGVGKLGL